MKFYSVLLLSLIGMSVLSPIKLFAQSPMPDPEGLDQLIHDLYDVISGPAGPRDWDRMRSLCQEDIRLQTVRRDSTGAIFLINMRLDDYIEQAGGFFEKTPFYESEIGRKVEYYGAVAHVFSTYQSQKDPEQEPFSRGINSIQLVYTAGKWKLINILWDAETKENPIPDRYLNK